MNFSFRVKSKPVFLAFIFSLIYWIYLLLSTTMEVKFDSMEYEKVGRLIFEQGWIEFFRHGPNREPLYPWLVSISMAIAQHLSVSYVTIQKILQIGLLWITQLLTLTLLKRMNVGETWKGLTIFYLGISPALVNCALSLFSEILTLPLVLSIILLTVRSWRELSSASFKKVFMLGAALTLLFLFLIGIKAVFEKVLPIFLLPFLFLSFQMFRKDEKQAALKIIFFVGLVLTTVNAGIWTYKSMNERYNGYFTLTDRGPWMLYANIERRSQPLSRNQFLAYLATIPGERVCYSAFSEKECALWSSETDSLMGSRKGMEIRNAHAGASNAQVNAEFVHLAKTRILENPVRHSLFIMLESLKMFFWESTQIGFVIYPLWLKSLYNMTLFKNSLRLLMFLVSFSSFFFAIYQVWKNRSLLFNIQSRSSEMIQTCFFAVLMITATVGLYALVNILTRFSFPIVPLFLLLNAYLLQNFPLKKR